MLVALTKQTLKYGTPGDGDGQGFHLLGFSPHCSEFVTFAKTVAICGDFHAGIWNVEIT